MLEGTRTSGAPLVGGRGLCNFSSKTAAIFAGLDHKRCGHNLVSQLVVRLFISVDGNRTLLKFLHGNGLAGLASHYGYFEWLADACDEQILF